ncbi:MAG: hypothetical protein ACOC04_05845 [Halothece sp.]
MIQLIQRPYEVTGQLKATPEQTAKLEATFEAFSNACNYIQQEVDPKLTNNVRIQSLVYQDIREKFDLSANLAVRAINRVSSHRKVAKKTGQSVKMFKPNRVDYDARIFSFREKDWTVSLSLVGGRERFDLLMNAEQQEQLKGETPASATLTKDSGKTYYLHINL